MARPVLAAVAEQQKVIEQLKAQNAWLYKAVNRLASVAGLRVTAEGGDDDADDKSDNSDKPPWLQDDGDKDADTKEARFRRQADEKNPADPIPDPASEAPYSTSDQARKPGLARGDVQQIGGVPGGTNVSADTTTTVDQIGGISADNGYDINEDVTKPISGTEGHIPLEDVRTRPRIEFGNPLKPDAAFPLNGDWANKVSLGSQARTYASLRLARLRMQAGIADPSGDDLILGQAIQTDAALTDGAIAQEIDTLTKVISVKAPARTSARRVAPQVERTTPSFSPGAQVLGSLNDSSDDGAFLFE